MAEATEPDRPDERPSAPVSADVLQRSIDDDPATAESSGTVTPVALADVLDDGPLQPGQVLLPGHRDARRLLILWWVRKSAYWLSFTGVTIAHLIGRSDETSVEWTDPDSVLRGLWSPLAGIVLAVLIRLLSGIVALGFAYPVVRRYLREQSPRTGITSGIGKLLDLRGLTMGFRRLRWSHHVREAAMARWETGRRRLGGLDQLLDIANIASFVVMMIVLILAVRT